MKRDLYFLSIIFLGFLTLSSCNQSEEEGRLTLGFDLLDENLQKSASSDNFLSHALITIVGEDGSLVYDKEPVELIRFGSGLVTRSLELPVGGFNLTEFMLTDSIGMVIWATPLEGSKLAVLVNEPLPRNFRIYADQSTSMNIQVVNVGNRPPADFGYVEFNIDFVESFCFKVSYDMILPEGEWDSLMMSPESSYMPWYESRVQIISGNRIVLDEAMWPGLNHYNIPVIPDNYQIIAYGLQKDTIFYEVFSLDELSIFACNPGNPPLMIPGKNPFINITPEGLHQPTIQQGVFGKITGPLDSFMDSTLKDMQPLIQDICFFPYHLIDSIYSLAPINCLVPCAMVPWEPLAIVRSNSEGFFQLELEAGEYLYLVKTEEGYYMDALLSSYRPGYVKVRQGEVFELSIFLADCSMWM